MSLSASIDIPPRQVFKILKSLYGLKQAVRDWNQLYVLKLKMLGFSQLEVDPCPLTYKESEIMILTQVYNIPIASPNLQSIKWFKEKFGKIFKIKDLREPDKIIGIRISRNRKVGALKLDPGHYIRESLAKLGMLAEKVKPALLLIDFYNNLRKPGPSNVRSEAQSFQEQTGIQMQPIVVYRPDLTFSVRRLSLYTLDLLVFDEKGIKKVV